MRPALVSGSARARAELGWEPHRSTLPQMIGDAWHGARSLAIRTDNTAQEAVSTRKTVPDLVRIPVLPALERISRSGSPDHERYAT